MTHGVVAAPIAAQRRGRLEEHVRLGRTIAEKADDVYAVVESFAETAVLGNHGSCRRRGLR